MCGTFASGVSEIDRSACGWNGVHRVIESMWKCAPCKIPHLFIFISSPRRTNIHVHLDLTQLWNLLLSMEFHFNFIKARNEKRGKSKLILRYIKMASGKPRVIIGWFYINFIKRTIFIFSSAISSLRPAIKSTIFLHADILVSTRIKVRTLFNVHNDENEQHTEIGWMLLGLFFWHFKVTFNL